MKEQVYSFSVVRDKEMFEHCILSNPDMEGIEVSFADNTSENLSISKRYNAFLERFDYSKPGWLVFCHEDFELRERLPEKLEGLDKGAIYGPCGARHRRFLGIVSIWEVSGRIRESEKDGSGEKDVGKERRSGLVLDTLDCMCLIVHSSLVERLKLRFDEGLSFDLYSEAFSMEAALRGGVKTRLLELQCCHHSHRTWLPESYFTQLAYLNKKYPRVCFASTCSYVGGNKLARNLCGPLLKIAELFVRKR